MQGKVEVQTAPGSVLASLKGFVNGRGPVILENRGVEIPDERRRLK